MRSISVWIVSLVLCLGLFACGEAPKEERAAPEPPLAPVDLPEVPADLGKSKIPERLADGNYTVHGIFKNRMMHMEKTVSVSGFVAWIYDCPHKEKETKKRRRRRTKKVEKDPNKPLCQRPHFYISDHTRGGDRMLVVGLGDDALEWIEKGKLKVGEQHTFVGTYADLGDGFAAPDRGLLMLQSIEGLTEAPK